MHDTTLIKTNVGTVRGTQQGDVRRFLGIPYAQNPVGELRFRHAQPMSAWDGVLEANAFGPISPQQHGTSSEADCLTLNIWAPAKGKKHPVLFFIHGGSFIYGSGRFGVYDGTNLCSLGDVIVVTFNYRLGPLGFIDLPDSRFDANCGFTDMMQALCWVHDNIDAFGGDPDNITLAGQSAGAICASAFPVHPQMRGLISKVMMMSGSPTYIRPKEEHEALCSLFLEKYADNDPDKLLRMSAKELMRCGRLFQRVSGSGEGTYSIYIDGDVIAESPIVAASQGAAHDIPIWLGTVREEMACAVSPLFSKSMDISGMINATEELEGPEMMDRIHEEYSKRYGKRGESLYLADRSFRIGSLWYAQVYSEYAPCWMYRFDYESRVMRILGLRAMHSTDLPLFFRNPDKTHFRLLYTLYLVRKGYRTVMEQINRDMFDFIRCGDLPWQQFTPQKPVARIYDEHVHEAPAVAENLRRVFESTKFHAMTFQNVTG